jgi:hypothetical protein
MVRALLRHDVAQWGLSDSDMDVLGYSLFAQITCQQFFPKEIITRDGPYQPYVKKNITRFGRFGSFTSRTFCRQDNRKLVSLVIDSIARKNIFILSKSFLSVRHPSPFQWIDRYSFQPQRKTYTRGVALAECEIWSRGGRTTRRPQLA